MKKNIFILCVAAFFAMSGSAFGLSLIPGNCPDDAIPCWAGTETGMTDIYDEIAALDPGPEIMINESTLLYKQDFNQKDMPAAYVPPDEGSFAPYYTTGEFDPDNQEASGAEIDFIGETGQEMTGAEYLLVKDGNSTPSWYLYGLGSWDGIETIELSGFWPDNGAISHVSIYGTSVPEPATLFLLGTALAGLAIFRRRRGSNSQFIHGETRGIQTTTA